MEEEKSGELLVKRAGFSELTKRRNSTVSLLTAPSSL